MNFLTHHIKPAMTSSLPRSSAAVTHFCNALQASSPLLLRQQRRRCLSSTSAVSSRAALLLPPLSQHRASSLASIAAFDRSSLSNSTRLRRNSFRAMATSGETKLDKNTPEEKWKEILTAEQVSEKGHCYSIG